MGGPSFQPSSLDLRSYCVHVWPVYSAGRVGDSGYTEARVNTGGRRGPAHCVRILGHTVDLLCGEACLSWSCVCLN